MTKSVLQQLKENERELRRRLIIDAAKKLFSTTSFHDIGMRTIANKAGISVASLYQYFPCQDDLYVEILKTDLQEIKNMLWREKTTLEDISVDIVDFYLDNEDVFQMMSHFMIRGEKNLETLKKFNKIQKIFFDLLSRTLSKTNTAIADLHYSRAFFTSLFGNIITFRNTNYTEEKDLREDLYNIVKITARAFQDLLDSDPKLKNSA